MKVRRILVVAALGVALLAGCATTEQKPMAAQEKSLYERLGGKAAITAVVDDFVGRVAADNRINSFFATTDIPRFKMNLVNQICEASGGPCKYTGRDMKTTHHLVFYQFRKLFYAVSPLPEHSWDFSDSFSEPPL